VTYPAVPTDPIRRLLWELVRSVHGEWCGSGGRPWRCTEGRCAEARALGDDLVAPDEDDIEMMRWEDEYP
jgi:hypothetical protein